MSTSKFITIQGDELILGPVRLEFQRTLRIPAAGLHDLPPGLGTFPLRRVEDYPDTAPSDWLARGGVMLPVYQREAMWLNFSSGEPAALQVAAGKICAVSGNPWSEALTQEPQNYVSLPDQPWLDGINAGDGFIRQFVAVPLGLGATVEGQVTGEEVVGGAQLRAVGLSEAALEEWTAARGNWSIEACAVVECYSEPEPAMGLGAGGRMRQEIYVDDRPVSDYDEERSWKVFVHLCSAEQWTAITGEVAPPTPVDREAYVEAGLPWFEYYDADRQDVARSEVLAKVKTVGEVLGDVEAPFQPVDPKAVVTLKHSSSDVVQQGDW